MSDRVDIIKDNMEGRRPTFNLFPYLWEQFDVSDLGISVESWDVVKFFDDNLLLNQEVDKVPGDKGGIYAYIIKNPNLPQLTNYLMYVGMATKGTSNSLYKRICTYYYKFKNETESRPLIEILLNKWAKYIHIAYITIDGDDIIEELEDRLINAILPPCNSEIPDRDVRKAVISVKAFG